MHAVRALEKSNSSDNLKFELSKLPLPSLADDQCRVQVHASGVNPSDVKALLGTFPHLVWPRTIGRDFAGTVIEGPSEHIGKEVWGTGGDLGLSRDGAHAEYLDISVSSIREKPANLTMTEAGSLGCAWTCAWLGLEDANIVPGETVIVFGANGKVGEASVQIATAAGANVLVIERSKDSYNGHSTGPVDVLNLQKTDDLKSAIMDKTEGRGADVIMNTAGSPYFEIACNTLAKEGRQIIISTFIEDCTLNLRTFYRGNHRLIGVSNADYDHTASAQMLEKISPNFESGTYKPYQIKESALFPLEKAGEAYENVIQDRTRDRMVIVPALSQ
ncbi:MAG: quinone oxidoreductase family protein [Methyloligellaceae bacterium]